MPRRGGSLAFLNDADPPIDILHVLPKERRQALARAVPTSDARRMPNPAAMLHKTEIKLIVLIAYQFFIEEPNPFEHLTTVDAADTKFTVVGEGNRFLHVRASRKFSF